MAVYEVSRRDILQQPVFSGFMRALGELPEGADINILCKQPELIKPDMQKLRHDLKNAAAIAVSMGYAEYQEQGEFCKLTALGREKLPLLPPLPESPAL